MSHDSISRWLEDARVQPKDLWEVAKKEVINLDGECNPGILAFDDVVIDKSRSGKTENDHFKDMCSNVKQRGLNPEMVVADSWYSSLDKPLHQSYPIFSQLKI